MNSSETVNADATQLSRDSQARQEIENFLKALNSYPESFEHDPCLTFEQHFVAVAGRGQ
jgi:hypothetical protein